MDYSTTCFRKSIRLTFQNNQRWIRQVEPFHEAQIFFLENYTLQMYIETLFMFIINEQCIYRANWLIKYGSYYHGRLNKDKWTFLGQGQKISFSISSKLAFPVQINNHNASDLAAGQF